VRGEGREERGEERQHIASLADLFGEETEKSAPVDMDIGNNHSCDRSV
jgi:hypothetical protein